MFVALAVVVSGACGDAGGADLKQKDAGADPRPTPEIAPVLEVICHADGSTELVNEDVRAQADGVHFRVDNRAGEFVSLNGTGMDFSEGVTEEVTRTPPGEIEIACWPGSMHREPEPEAVPIRIHDPEDHWVPAELGCPDGRTNGSTVLDYAYGSVGMKGDPTEIARDQMKGIASDDEIITVGYPESEYRQVAVVRDDAVVALLSYSPDDVGGWILGSYSSCASTRIHI